MNIREQIMTFLLQQCDVKDSVIEDQKKRIAELEKQLEASQPRDVPAEKAAAKAKAN